jgi:hypothetical protein
MEVMDKALQWPRHGHGSVEIMYAKTGDCQNQYRRRTVFYDITSGTGKNRL